MNRRLCIAISILTLFSASSLMAAFKKPYFAKTKPGSWASYQSDDGTKYRYVRLADADGHSRVQMVADFSATKYKDTPASTNQYTMEKGFAFDRNAISFGHFATELLMKAGEMDPMALEGEGFDNVRKFAIDYDAVTKFVGSETVEGRKVDHYSYVTGTMPDGEIERGDIWMSDEVPFGLVKQTAARSGPDGEVKTKYTMTLKKSGGGEVPTPLARPKAED
jgi:hypothetical protein